MGFEFSLVDLISILIGIIGIYIAVKTKREAWKIAEESGAFRKPDIGLAVFDCQIGNGYPDNEDWCFIHPGKSDDYAVYPIKFTIFNQGDTSTSEILFSIHVPNRIFWKAQLEGMAILTYPSLASESIKQSVDEIGNFTLISFSVPPLSPSSSLGLILPFSFNSTLEDFSFPIELNKTILKPHVKFLYHNIVSMTIYAENIPPKSYQVNFSAISAPKLSDGVDKFRNMKKPPTKKRVMDYILDIFKREELHVTNFVSFEIESKTQVKKRKVFIMKSPSQLYRGGWLNIPSKDTKELETLESGCIVGVIDIEKIPASERKLRFKEGNLIEE